MFISNQAYLFVSKLNPPSRVAALKFACKTANQCEEEIIQTKFANFLIVLMFYSLINFCSCVPLLLAYKYSPKIKY